MITSVILHRVYTPVDLWKSQVPSPQHFETAGSQIGNHIVQKMESLISQRRI